MPEKYQAARATYEMIKNIPEPQVQSIATWLEKVFEAVDEGKPIVYNQFTFWCELMVAMDIAVIAPEAWPLAGALATGGAGYQPSDTTQSELSPLRIAEAAGLAVELCVGARAAVGMVLGETMPPATMITLPSYPCDSTKSVYQVLSELTEAPLYLVDCPYWMDDEGERMEYWVNQYKGLISFLEEHSGKKMDYDRLKEVAKESNRYCEYWLEGTEILKMKPLPQNGPFSGAEILFTLGLPVATEAMKARLDPLKARVANGESAVPEENIRVVWNYLPILWDRTLPDWMIEEFGAVTPVGMGSWRQFEPIDTSTTESTIRGMAKRALHAHMGRQGRGSADIWIEDSLNAYEQWQGDCMITAAHFACKWMRGSGGLLRDICRQRGIPYLFFDVDIGDPSAVPGEEVRARIGEFLDNVQRRIT